MQKIDSLTENKVYADPVQKMQEDMLQEMLKLRVELAKTIEEVCKNGGGSGAGSSADLVKVQAENKKLKYRIVHLLKALNGDSPSAGESYKLYTTEGHHSINVNQCQITAALCGASLEFILVDDDMKVTKEHKALNPTGKYPLLETKEGSLAGVVTICKFLCKQSKKFLGDGSPLQTTQIDQWMNWTTNTLEPTCQCVLQGIFGEEVYQGTWDQASKDLKNLCKTVNTAVSDGFLVGGQLSLADVIVATALMVPFQTVLDAGFRKAMKPATDWAEKIFAM